MPTHTVVLDVELPDERSVDLFLLQLHTPAPIEAGGLGPYPPPAAVARGECLQRFAEWLNQEYRPAHPNRPFFVILPELSVPRQHLHILEEIAAAADRPAFVIAGIEFLRFEQYRDLLESMNAMPDRAGWLANGHAGNLVNAAFVAVRDDHGQVQHFLQTKRNASDPEAHVLFRCAETLLFRSANQTNGPRINFCVQICADFVSDEHVREFRQGCEQELNGRPLDFTIVLQRNEDQTVPHFKRSISAYFGAADGMVSTDGGCLIFVNNASETFGRSDAWGKSMLLFPYRHRWRISPSPTYWLSDDGGHNHQAVVLREPGPMIYWLSYKPQYLVDRTPGSGQPGPFVGNRAVALSINEQVFPLAVAFKPIHPVSHWLVSEWTTSEPAFVRGLREAHRPAAVSTALQEAYIQSLDAWRETFEDDDTRARHLVTLYFKGFPGRVLGKDTKEPQRWEANTAAGARYFLELYCVLQSGIPAALNLRPLSTDSGHASVSESTAVALLWGESERPSASLIASGIEALQSSGGQAYEKLILILVAPLDAPSPERLAVLVAENQQEITRPLGGQGGAENEVQITEAGSDAHCSALTASWVWNLVFAAPTPEELSARIVDLVGLEGP